MPRPAHPALADQFANMAAGNRFAAQVSSPDRPLPQIPSRCRIREQVHIASSLVAEAEVVAFMHFARMQFFLQDALGELARRHQRKIAAKGKQQYRIDPCAFEQAEFFRRGSEQLQSGVGPQNASGMRLKGTATAFPPCSRPAQRFR